MYSSVASVVEKILESRRHGFVSTIYFVNWPTTNGSQIPLKRGKILGIL